MLVQYCLGALCWLHNIGSKLLNMAVSAWQFGMHVLGADALVVLVGARVASA